MTFKLIDDMILWAERGEVPKRQIIMEQYPELDRFGHRHWDLTGKFPDDREPIGSDAWLDKARQRDKVIAKYGFAIPCQEAIEEIRKYQPLIEVGAGSGFWTYLLNKCNINCIASDPGNSFNHILTHASYDVEFLKLDGAEAVTKYPDRNVLMIWPSHHEPWAERVLKAMQSGRKLLSVTEDRGGCCATDKFFNLLKICFEKLDDVRLPQWDGIHDELYIHKKKEL